MLAVERRNQIEKIITEHKSVLVADLAKKFDVTPETIRGDLEKLERQGVLVRTYGGATLVDNVADDMTIQMRDTINYEGKHNIGKKAASLIRDGETIFLDASTSSLHVARNIKDKHGVTVITNAEKVVSELANCDDIRVICVGGKLEPKNMSYIGRIAEKIIRESYCANKFFFSCRGITLHRGLMESSEAEAEIKKAMMDMSETSIFLCDRSKLGKLGIHVISDITGIDSLITDVKLDEEWEKSLIRNDVDLIQVDGE